MPLIKSLQSEYPEIAAEWDYEKNDSTPDCVAPKCNEFAHWVCKKCGYSWIAKISNRANGRGCPLCENRVIVSGVNDLATLRPEIAKEWHPTKNDDLLPTQFSVGCGKKFWWLCPRGHSYQATILHRTYGIGTNCPICNSGRQTSFAEQAFYYYIKKVFPNAISRYKDIFDNGMELDIYIPEINLGIEYDGEAWHKPNKYEREERKFQICKEHGIKLLRLVEGEYELGKFNANSSICIPNMYQPKILEKAIHQLLDRTDPSSNMFTRKNPYHFMSDIDVNIERDEQEIRSYMIDLKSGSLAEKFPNLVKEWDKEKNGTLNPYKFKPMSDTKVFWICPTCGKSYKASIGHRTTGTGCPDCGIKKNTLARSKAVNMINIEDGSILKTFVSITEAGREMHISTGNIVAVCNGKRNQASGYKWEYVK